MLILKHWFCAVEAAYLYFLLFLHPLPFYNQLIDFFSEEKPNLDHSNKSTLPTIVKLIRTENNPIINTEYIFLLYFYIQINYFLYNTVCQYCNFTNPIFDLDWHFLTLLNGSSWKDRQCAIECNHREKRNSWEILYHG